MVIMFTAVVIRDVVVERIIQGGFDMGAYYIDLESLDDMKEDHYYVSHEVYWKVKKILDEYTAERAEAIN